MEVKKGMEKWWSWQIQFLVAEGDVLHSLICGERLRIGVYSRLTFPVSSERGFSDTIFLINFHNLLFI